MMLHISLLLALFIFVQTPFLCKEQDFRIQKEPIAIKVDRTSPAFMALLETLQSSTKEQEVDDVVPVQETITLRAGESVPLNERMFKQKDQVVTLPTMRISARDFIEDLEELRLTPRMEQRLRGAHIDSDELRDLVKPNPTLQERAQDLVKQEIQKVALYERGKPSVAPVPSIAAGGRNLVVSASLPSHSVKAPENDPQNDPQTDTTSFMGSSNHERPRRAQPHPKVVVQGSLEISEGLAFIGDRQRFKFHRVQSGSDMFMEEGFVDAEKGTYEISIKDPRGVLIAEVLSREGEVLGRGEATLEQNIAASFENGQERAEGPKMIIKPTSFGISGQVISEADSYDQFIWPVPKAIVTCQEQSLKMKANGEGYYEELAYLGGSSLILEAKSEKFWSTLRIALGGEPNPMLLFSEERVQALLNWDRPRVIGREIAYPAIIWGKVVDEKGKPVEGARIIVASETPVWPTYFKWHLPETSTLSETSVDGEFAIVGLRDEAVSLKAIKGQRVSTIEVVPARENTISPVRLVFSETKRVPIEIFDGMAKNEKVSASIKEIGADEEMFLGIQNEVNFISFSEKTGLLFLETESDEYVESRHIMPASTPVVSVPMVRREWLTDLLKHRKISMEPGTGAIVGFLQGGVDSIQLEEGLNYDYQNLFFFDSNGEIVDEVSRARGGGYILYNVPVGFRTVSIYPEGSSRFFSQIFIVDSAYLSIADHLF